MIRIAAAALALTLAAPVVTVPATADAQVMTGRNAARQATRPSPRPLSDREYERLSQAENEVQEADNRIAEIQAAAEQSGGMTPEHQAEMQALQRKRDQANRIVERLSRRL